LHSEATATWIDNIGVVVSADGNRILALTMGLDASYDPFVIFLDSTPNTHLNNQTKITMDGRQFLNAH
jgi:hypothetical protein